MSQWADSTASASAKYDTVSAGRALPVRFRAEAPISPLTISMPSETALMTAREASDELCARLNAEGVSCVGSRFVVYRRSETLARKTGTAHPKVKVNPVRSGIRRRRAIARAERERRNTFFREAAIAQAKQRRKDAGNED